MNVTVAWEDVVSVVNQISGYLIAVAVALVVLIAGIVAAKKIQKPKRGFVRKQFGIAFFLAVVVIVNAILTGPMENLISAATIQMGELTEETVENSRNTIERIAEEGIVLAKNTDAALPLQKGTALNVFGWASTSPIYGGTGSGTVDASRAVSLLQGLENAGFTLNNELENLHTEYRADRPVVSINEGQDWTLPEIPAEAYSSDILDRAREFSDTALIVLARPGGEGADLPHDMAAVLDGSWDKGTKYTKGSYQNNSNQYEDFTEGQTYLELSQTERNLVEMVCSNFENVIVVYNGSNTMEMGWTDEYEQIRGVLLCPAAGETGFNGLGRILNGEVNPSARTTDTWVKDLTETPYFRNIGHFAYENVSDVTEAAKEVWPNADGIVSFVNYVENIYVGYRFYETAAEEGFITYEDAVQYPFGYGLSYTSFEQEMGSIQERDGNISVNVTVLES